MTLLDRLVGYDDDQDKIPIQQFVDALLLRDSGHADAPTDAEMVDWFGLNNAEALDRDLIQALVAGRSFEISPRSMTQAALRLAEYFPTKIRKPRLRRLMGLPRGNGGGQGGGGINPT